MALTVNVRTRSSTTVVSLAGLGSDALLERVAEGIAALVEDGKPIVVDLTDVTLTDPKAINLFLSVLAVRAPGTSLVCDRLSGRRVLRRYAPGPAPRVFPSIDEALADNWARRPASRGLRPVG